MSRPELADAVNAALDQLYPGRDLTAHYVDFRWIGKLERGEHRWPSDERRTALRHVLGSPTDASIGLYSPRRTDAVQRRPYEGRSGSVAVVYPSTAGLVPVGRTATAGYVGVEQAIMLAARECSEHARETGTWAVPDGVIDQLRNDVRGVARRFDALTPAEAVNETFRVRNLAVELLSRTRRPAQLNDLYFTVAQAMALLASASIDLGLWATARQYAQAAEQYGEVIDHAGVRAYALGLQATAAYWTGQPMEAVHFASLAVEQAPAGVARVRAFSILARAWSHRGSVDEVRRALNSADAARSAEGCDELHDLIGGEFGYALPQQARSASTAWLQVGQADEATTSARQALDALSGAALEPWSTVEAEARVDLATCLFLTGDVNAARETLVSLWTMPPDWRRVGLLGRVRRVQDLLSAGRWRSVRAAREVAEAAAVFAATAKSTPELPPA
ncbi:XRE family transcriptional regulator [Dactylosporangium sp. NPDC048998]|uniref:XRE family transcriptional regulator n=1 Tax=Dactylosporangium sp. NPDC048998 TaxID=3363976 RepID=UPI0037157982